MDPPVPVRSAPPRAARSASSRSGKWWSAPPSPLDDLVEVGRVGERAQPFVTLAAGRGIAGSVTSSAELSCTRPIRIPARASRSSACERSSYSTAKWQQSKQTRTWSRRRPARRRARQAESRPAATGAPSGNSQLLEERDRLGGGLEQQSGSGSMSRWISTPRPVAARTSAAATRATLRVMRRPVAPAPAVAIHAL